MSHRPAFASSHVEHAMTIRVFALLGLLASSAVAARVVGTDGRPLGVFPINAPSETPGDATRARGLAAAGPNDVTYHGGPVMRQARVVSIFWGVQWGVEADPSALAQHVMAFFGRFGTSTEYNTITQYSDTSGPIALANLTTTHWFDPTNPPAAVDDAAVQAEVRRAVASSGIGLDDDTIYEVFLPSTSYATEASLGSSCGGPSLGFCAYHSYFWYGGLSVKYASMPYPSCAQCQTQGWSTGQNLDHFSCHETREAVTDPQLNAWYDASGDEADDKCAWSPDPFLDTGFGYQWEWSNAHGGCITSLGCPASCDDQNACTDDACGADYVCHHTLQPRCLAPALTLLLDEPSCGDGVVESGEECDDGNTADGDGCDHACHVVPIPIAGTKLSIKDATDPTRRTIALVADDPAIAPSLVDPLSAGAYLQVYAPGTGESVCIALPSLGTTWQAAGTPPNVLYKYRDAHADGGPCKSALLRSGRLIVKCRATVKPIAYSLDEPSQQQVVVRFSSGTRTFCASFGGTITKDVGLGATSSRGLFAAKSAPAPTTCPVAPSSCP